MKKAMLILLACFPFAFALWITTGGRMGWKWWSLAIGASFTIAFIATIENKFPGIRFQKRGKDGE